MIIDEHWMIPDEELVWSFARSGGPGGQNVNKTNTRAVLHWHLTANTSLPLWLRERLAGLERNRLTTQGVLVLQSQMHRTQERNREACLERLRDLVRRAATLPRPRRLPSHPAVPSCVGFSLNASIRNVSNSGEDRLATRKNDPGRASRTTCLFSLSRLQSAATP
ncbi:MAG: alternative ribosome rescue aminoacyl-tRNA hydrolase ArfB [Gemmataceae bacterium]